MRIAVPLLLLAVFLAGCRGTQLYSKQDLQQVHQAWNELRPTYLAFERAYKQNDVPAMLADYHRERRQCKLVDVIDNRDSIDPNVHLFAASAALDDICNTIESAYTTWAIPHHYPYDQNVVPSRKGDEFIGMDLEFKEIPKWLRHPSTLT
jgi:hypothetical protein